MESSGSFPPKQSAEIFDIDNWRKLEDWKAVLERRRMAREAQSVDERVNERQAELNLERAEHDFEKLYENVRAHLHARTDVSVAKIDITRLFNNLAYMKEINGAIPAHIYRKMEALEKELQGSPQGSGGGPVAA